MKNEKVNTMPHAPRSTPHASRIDLSIIIVCYKGWTRLYKCLAALNSFTGSAFSSEVIVVDNKSGDEEILNIEKQFSKFRFIYNESNGGFANGSNLGASYASGDFILFLNPDTVAIESEIEKLLSVAKQNSKFSVISCKQLSEKGKESVAYGPFPDLFNLTGFQRAIFKSVRPQIKEPMPDISFPDWISGSVILIRHDTFNKLNGFDEDYWMYFEDVDLCKRIHDNSGIVAFCNFATIEHNHGGSSRINLKTTTLTKTEVHISRHVYISKNKRGIERLLIQTFTVFNNLISGFIMAFLGLVFFFIPKAFARTLIYYKLISYYTGSLFRLSWISPRSVNFHKK
jgi:GT2 family glycosyltransferase